MWRPRTTRWQRKLNSYDLSRTICIEINLSTMGVLRKCRRVLSEIKQRMAMAEQRKEPRQRIKEWAKVVLMDQTTVYNCTISDISQNGACLRVGDARVPDDFYLFRKRDNTVRVVVVRSRRYGAIGVQYIAFADEQTADTVRDAVRSRSKATVAPPRRSDGREIFTSAFEDSGFRRRVSDG
jgi:hypothetical protein